MICDSPGESSIPLRGACLGILYLYLVALIKYVIFLIQDLSNKITEALFCTWMACTLNENLFLVNENPICSRLQVSNTISNFTDSYLSHLLYGHMIYINIASDMQL